MFNRSMYIYPFFYLPINPSIYLPIYLEHGLQWLRRKPRPPRNTIYICMYLQIYLSSYQPIYQYNLFREEQSTMVAKKIPTTKRKTIYTYMYIPMSYICLKIYISTYLPTYLLIQRNGLQWLRRRPRPPRKKQSTYIINMYIPTQYICPISV